MFIFGTAPGCGTTLENTMFLDRDTNHVRSSVGKLLLDQGGSGASPEVQDRVHRCMRAQGRSAFEDLVKVVRMCSNTSCQKPEDSEGSAGQLTAKCRICSRCKEACYCSKKCQAAGWKRHKFECVKAPERTCEAGYQALLEGRMIGEQNPLLPRWAAGSYNDRASGSQEEMLTPWLALLYRTMHHCSASSFIQRSG